jgi:hypothetical protein
VIRLYRHPGNPVGQLTLERYHKNQYVQSRDRNSNLKNNKEIGFVRFSAGYSLSQIKKIGTIDNPTDLSYDLMSVCFTRPVVLRYNPQPPAFPSPHVPPLTQQ